MKIDLCFLGDKNKPFYREGINDVSIMAELNGDTYHVGIDYSGQIVDVPYQGGTLRFYGLYSKEFDALTLRVRGAGIKPWQATYPSFTHLSAIVAHAKLVQDVHYEKAY